MKIVLTHAYFLNLDPKEKAIMKPYPPLGLLYISAWLDKFGMDNEVYDATFSDPNSQRQYLLKVHPDIIAIYANLMSKIMLADLISFIRSENIFDQTLIVLGGPDVTYNIENYLSLGADVLVIGEGEETMLELAISYEGKSKAQFHHIDGIAFVDEKKESQKPGHAKKCLTLIYCHRLIGAR
ncbi:MAG: cobalamin B12-binding domain-containing protein [Saprospiraceae bacterium]|nr:cobalamin B12-binding domain-containing protein [Saprospiraceae bacterium]